VWRSKRRRCRLGKSRQRIGYRAEDPSRHPRQVFLPFFGQDGSTRMGLAMVQKIVVSHGGQVEIGDRRAAAPFSGRLPSDSKTAGPNESARKAGAKA
jgi:hypothetical protein